MARNLYLTFCTGRELNCGAGGSLTADEWRRFHTDGYLVVPQLMAPSEVARITGQSIQGIGAGCALLRPRLPGLWC